MGLLWQPWKEQEIRVRQQFWLQESILMAKKSSSFHTVDISHELIVPGDTIGGERYSD